jgi:triosephosphate isomerase
MAMQRWAVGNWKMNGSLGLIDAYVPALLRTLPEGWQARGAGVALCPPYPYLAALGERLRGTGVALGAQQVHPVASGAFTGEVSPSMLAEFGVNLCIVGHSERRQYFGETNPGIAQKVYGLVDAGIAPILCIGETLEQREAGRQEEVIRTQLLEAFRASEGERMGRRHGDMVYLEHPELTAEQVRRLIVAYEPVWAIGTGRTATPEQANEMHAFIRTLLAERFGAGAAAAIPILYGGSVNPGNVASLMVQPEINGTLVGGASLKPESFLPIIEHSLS